VPFHWALKKSPAPCCAVLAAWALHLPLQQAGARQQGRAQAAPQPVRHVAQAALLTRWWYALPCIFVCTLVCFTRCGGASHSPCKACRCSVQEVRARPELSSAHNAGLG